MRVIAFVLGAVGLGSILIGAADGSAQRGYPPLAAAGSAVAQCDRSMRGVGIPSSQRPTKRRSSFRLFEFTPDFRRLRRHRNSLLRTKAPIAVSGDAPVTVSVPERARHRLALSYAGSRGRYAEIEFQPCAHKARTSWPGGFLLRDRMPVAIHIAVGDESPRRLRLGRPHRANPSWPGADRRSVP